MRKIAFIIILHILAAQLAQAQQIKRWTLTSNGRVKAQPTYRMSWTAGSCPGCNVLNGGSAGFLRQGFQQPPQTNNDPACANLNLSATFNVTPIVTPTCGTKFDFEFTGQFQAGMTVLWDFGDGAFPRTSTQLNPMGIAYATVGQKFISLTVKLNNCTDTKSRSVTISLQQIGFSAAVTTTNVKCFGQKTGVINLTTSGGTGTKTYVWSTGATTQNLTGIGAGRYGVTTTDAGGCMFVLDTIVRQPQADLSYRDSITLETCGGYADGSIYIAPIGGTKPYSFLWSNRSTNANIDSLVKGTYRLVITDSNGCKIDTGFTLRRRCDDSRIDTNNKVLFDIITPNGDGLNDTWTVDGLNKYPNHEVFLYNRWGQLIYTIRNYANDWNGTNSKGEELPSAAYFYVIQLGDDKQTVWSGSVTVVR